MTEHAIQSALRIAASRCGWRVFRNNVGAFWQGSEEFRLADGSVLLRNARRVRCGLVAGSGDLIGWRPVTITPDMVGQTIAQFVSVEVKTETGRVSTPQRRWKSAVNAAGGHALIARDADALNPANTETPTPTRSRGRR